MSVVQRKICKSYEEFSIRSTDSVLWCYTTCNSLKLSCKPTNLVFTILPTNWCRPNSNTRKHSNVQYIPAVVTSFHGHCSDWPEVHHLHRHCKVLHQRLIEYKKINTIKISYTLWFKAFSKLNKIRLISFCSAIVICVSLYLRLSLKTGEQLH